MLSCLKHGLRASQAAGICRDNPAIIGSVSEKQFSDHYTTALDALDRALADKIAEVPNLSIFYDGGFSEAFNRHVLFSEVQVSADIFALRPMYDTGSWNSARQASALVSQINAAGIKAAQIRVAGCDGFRLNVSAVTHVAFILLSRRLGILSGPSVADQLCEHS